jgi:CBS domain-containing protein
MNIREVMTPNPQCVTPGDSIQNAARIMRDCDTGAVPVVDNGRPVGIVTDRDIVVRAVADGGLLSRPVREIVSGNIVCVSPDMSTHEAAGRRKRADRRHRFARRPCREGSEGQARRRHARAHFRRREGTRLAVQLEPREQQQREHDQHDDDGGERRTAGRLEERSVRRGLDARLRRRIAALVANQRLVGDLGSTVFADHRRASGSALRASGKLEV